jgi:nicotinamide-nucleotide amidase
MSQTNLKQALRPDDAIPLINRMGTAPGLFWDVTEKVAQLGWGTGPKYIFAFPGVPREMMTMWEEGALPILQPKLPEQLILVSHFLKFMGIGESLLAEKLRDLMAQSTPTVSPYVGQAEVKIRIAAKAKTSDEAEALIQPVEAEILKRAGAYYYGKDDDLLEDIVGRLLKEKDWCLSVVESCTGGLLSSRLTDVSGSSDYIGLNMVTYSNEAKTAELAVQPETLAQYGAVSPQVAKEMAVGILKKSGANVAMSITGIAGPTGGSAEKPIGLAYMGFTQQGQAEPVVKKIMINPKYPRQQIKLWFTQYALNNLRMYLQGSLHPDE